MGAPVCTAVCMSARFARMATEPLRSVRVADPIWQAAKVRAAQRGETVTAAVIRFLDGYGRETRTDDAA